MTIEVGNIVLSAVILVLMTGGGLWLKYVVEQQLKSKDTTIEALKGVVQLKDAHIASLEGNTAPAITKAYAEMRQHADSMTGESQRLSVQLADLSKQHQVEKDLLLPKLIMSEIEGLQMAERVLKETVWTVLLPNGVNADPKYLSEEFEPLCESILAASLQINRAVSTEIDRGRDLMKKLESH